MAHKREICRVVLIVHAVACKEKLLLNLVVLAHSALECGLGALAWVCRACDGFSRSFPDSGCVQVLEGGRGSHDDSLSGDSLLTARWSLLLSCLVAKINQTVKEGSFSLLLG